MTYNTGNKDVEKGWSSIYSIWLSMLGALFFYLVFGLFIKDRVHLGISDDTVVIIRYALYTVSVVTFVLAGLLKSKILRSGITGRKYPHFSDNDAVSKYTMATVVSDRSRGAMASVHLYLIEQATDGFRALDSRRQPLDLLA